MKYCSECGTKLIMKKNGIDGLVPYCPQCQQFRFIKFSSAISAIIFNPQKDKILLLKQYGNPSYILLSGYINPGENAKQALKREMEEETKLKIAEFHYNDNAYFAAHDVLIHNYVVIAASDKLDPNNEIDQYSWVPVDEVLDKIMPNSLAKSFVEEWFQKEHL
ncbi:NUDIX domain-containing protein [Limosilactobacillus viscerum]|uniref:NUDIX domain-containing protein n=1 Tax=Limosilactobacillus viscerum TaxID=2993450 RepID=UPI0024BB28D0|nr:NUDIX domain-containing protein [Limosilactobacillus viscerum]